MKRGRRFRERQSDVVRKGESDEERMEEKDFTN
jgi:hypothetical protein